MVSDLIAFIKKENLKRGWSNNELAHHMGYTGTWVSNIMTQRDPPSVKFCNMLAKVYHEPPENILRMAGLIPEKSEPPKTKVFNELVDILQRLEEDKLQNVVDFARFQLEKKARP